MFLAPISDSEKLDQPEKAISPSTAGSRIRDNLMSIRFAILVFLLSLFMKLWETNSIRMWDEGWYADIAARMADTMENGGDWAFPVYMEFGLLRMFDKPPLIFWVTGFLIIIFGRSTLALKLPIAFSGAMLAVIAYYLYSGDRDDRTAGALAGLMMAAAYFVNFYSRTAYIDITMVFLSSLTVLFAKRAIDAFVDHGNVGQGSLFLVLTGIVNALNLLLKAWQGLIVGPALGIYLLVKVYQKETNLSRTREILESLENLARLHRLVVLFPNDLRRKTLTAARSLSFISFSLAFFLFSHTVWGLPISLVLLLLIICILFMILLSSTFPEEKTHSSFELAIYAALGIPLGSVLGFFSFLGLNFLVGFITPYYQVMEDLAHGIGDSGGGYAILYLGLPEELLGKSSKEQIGDFLSGIFSLIPVVAAVVVLSVLVACFASFILAILADPNHQSLVRENLAPMLPILLLGSWMVFWATQVVLGGLFFNHDPIPTVLVGFVVAAFILTFFATLNSKIENRRSNSSSESDRIISQYRDLALRAETAFEFALIGSIICLLGFLVLYSIFNWEPWIGVIFGIAVFFVFLIALMGILRGSNRFGIQKALRNINSRLLLAGFAVIVAVLSFLPFLAWLDYAARNVSKLPYLDPNRRVRRPGELPEALYQEHKDDILRWFFFEYYIGWRYENPSPNEDYNMWNAVHSAFADPIFVAMIPIFFIGIYAFFRTKKTADGLLYTTWFFSTLLVFLPASFQLNYYYLACFLPFYLVVAKGVVYMFRESRAWWGYEYLAVLIGVLTLGFIIHRYWIVTYEFLSIPLLGIKGQMLPSGPHLHNLNLFILIGGIGASLLLLYWIRVNLNIVGLALVFVVVLSSLIAISYSIHVSADWDPRLEEIASFILEHNGDYNESTWVFSDAGTEYALRYYLGNEIFKEGGRWANGEYVVPFTDNTSSSMENFVNAFPRIKFWIVLNDTYRDHDTPEKIQSHYSEAYSWLKENYDCVDDRIGIPEWLAYHVFADPSVF